MVVAGSPAVQPGGATRFIALDSLRGLIAVGIMLFHMGDFGWIAGWTPLRSGWMLVEFFFVLSGFVIASAYGERLAGGYPRGQFLLVRFGRLYPLHLVVVIGFVLLEFLVFRPVFHEAHPLAELWRALFLLDAFRIGTGNFFAPVSWAIAVELVLYVLAALLFGRGWLGVAIAVVLAATSAWALCADFAVEGFGRPLQRGLVGFPVGVACLWLFRRTRGLEVGPALLTLLEAGLLLGLVWVLYQPHQTNAWLVALDVLFAAMVLVFARDGGLVSRALQWPPLVRLGQLSFALFMMHLFTIIVPNRLLPGVFVGLGHPDWVRPGRHWFGFESVAPPQLVATLITLAAAAIALALAWLAWRFVEEPARESTRKLVSPEPAKPI